MDRTLNHPIEAEKLGCYIERIKPFLDFAFRFGSGYEIACPVKIFEGKGALLNVFTRIVPIGQAPVVLRDGVNLPPLTGDANMRMDVRKLKAELQVSGVFFLGEGEYSIDVLLIDDRRRVSHKKWTIKTERNRSEREVQVSIPSNTVRPVSTDVWNPPSPAGSGTHVTILLDAAPMNPFALKLRSMDRAFLVQSLLSVLKQLNPDTIRLVAFNLDQQREVFRKDDFKGDDIFKLDQALRELELGTIKYATLQQPTGWADLLLDLIKGESVTAPTPDAVIFIGPTNRYIQKLPTRGAAAEHTTKPRFIYLEFYPYWRIGNEFPDSIQYAVARHEGMTLKVHSPAELAQDIRKIKAVLETQDEARSQ